MNGLVIRADGNSSIGAGHVMRCLALAQAWQALEGTVHIAVADTAPALETRLREEGIGVCHIAAPPGSAMDAIQTIELARQLKAAGVVVDGYRFNANYHQTIKRAGLCLLVVDDYGHADHYYGDLVLNQNLSAEESLYASREPATQLLLGTQYAMLRREFLPWRGWRHTIVSTVRQVLVTLGGADPDNITGKIVTAMKQMRVPGLDVQVVVGPANPHLESLRQAAQNAALRLRLLTSVNHMPELMAWADLAISAGGSTCWELAFMGVPTIALELAENQCSIARSLDRAGVVINLGSSRRVTENEIADTLAYLLPARERRQAMSISGQRMVDGDGASRVAGALRLHLERNRNPSANCIAG